MTISGSSCNELVEELVAVSSIFAGFSANGGDSAFGSVASTDTPLMTDILTDMTLLIRQRLVHRVDGLPFNEERRGRGKRVANSVGKIEESRQISCKEL